MNRMGLNTFLFYKVTNWIGNHLSHFYHIKQKLHYDQPFLQKSDTYNIDNEMKYYYFCPVTVATFSEWNLYADVTTIMG